MNRTSIEWTDFTANPLKFHDAAGKVVWGCVHASPGCQHCYAETLAQLHKMLTYKPASGKRCFVGDMTDVFGPWVPDELLDRLFAVLALRSDITWQVLTKRAQRMRDYLTQFYNREEEVSLAITRTAWWESPQGSPCAVGAIEDQIAGGPLPNVWLGVSCEDQPRADERIPLLLETPAALRFVSAEPLLGPIVFKQQNPDGYWPPKSPQPDVAWLRHKDWPDDFQYWTTGIGWVIVGGESGPQVRFGDGEWFRSIVRQCKAARVPVFVKQLGARPSLKNRKGGDPSEWPEDLRVREFPRGRA